MIIKMKIFIKKLLAPWLDQPERIRKLTQQVQLAVGLITERTTVHADIHFRSGLQNIIVVGHYHNHDYVRCFGVDVDDFAGIVDMLRRIEPKGRIGRIDVPYPSFDAVRRIERERGQQ